MLQIFIQSFVRAEVTIGIVLTVLLISGRNDPKSIAFSLGGLGMFSLLYGILPLSRKGPVALQTPSENEEPSPDDRQPATSETICSKKPFNRRDYFIRATLMSLIMIGTACLIYWFAPPLT